MEEREAVCASHPDRRAVRACSRCGRFACEAGAKTTPCLECQVLQRQTARRLSPRLAAAIGVLLALYAVCTVLMVPAMAQIDFLKLNPKTLGTGPMLLLVVLEGVYSAVAAALLVAYLVWYVGLVDWARARGITVPGSGAAVAYWFVPFVNLVHPFRTIRTIQEGTGVKAPVVLWWSLFWGSIVLSTVGTARLGHGGYDAVFVVASLLEIVAAYLCWVVVNTFRAADQSWTPGEALALRDAGLASSPRRAQ